MANEKRYYEFYQLLRRDIVSLKSASTSRSGIKFTKSMEDSYVPLCKLIFNVGKGL